MKFYEEMAKQAQVTVSANAESAFRTAGRSLEMVEACSQLFFGGLRDSLNQQKGMLKQVSEAKDPAAAFGFPLQAFQDFQTQMQGIQQLVSGYWADYFAEMLPQFEGRAAEAREGAELFMTNIKGQIPVHSESVKKAVDAWIDMATKGIDQATEHGKRFGGFPQMIAQMPVQKTKAKGNGASA